jgi:dipeptidyl aminopeptidase/acylaminoacyl peptidase
MLVIQISDTNPDHEVAMHLARPFASLASCGTLLWMLSAPALIAQEPARPDVAAELAASRVRLAAENYVTPPAEIVKLVTAPRHLNVSLTRQSPDRRHFLREESSGLPGVNDFGKPHYYFGGLQVDPAANRARALTTRGSVGLSLIDAATGRITPIEVPAGATVSSPAWSPDSRRIAYIANFDRASHLYVADVATGKSRALTRTPLLATLVTSLDWTGDGSRIVTVLVPEQRGAEPVRPAIATGPAVQVWMDSLKSPQRMYASLLQGPYEQALMEYYTTGQLVAIDVRTRAAGKIGEPAMLSSVEPSPDGKYFRVTTMRKPFSYVVQYTSFGELEQIWDAGGKVLAEVAKRPLRESPDTSDTPRARRDDGGKRALAWMPRGEGMYYLEAIPVPRGRSTDSADAGSTPAARSGAPGAGGSNRPDRLVRWMPPFGPGDTTVLHRADSPISQLVWSEDAATVFLGVTRNGTGEIYAVRLSEPDKKYTIVRQRGYTPVLGAGAGGFGGGRGGNAADTLSFYTNPGSLMTRSMGAGSAALVSSDGAVYLSGTQYHRNYLENPPRAFIDKVTIATGAKSRVFEGSADLTESVVAPLDDDFSRAIVVRESASQVPNSFLRDMKSGALVQLTDNKDRTPEFTTLTRKRVIVTRADGIKFLVRVTLPAGYQTGTRLPGMFWFYPYEYTDQAGYDRTLRTENLNRFPVSQPRTIEYLATQGYAVANFDPPIIGETGRMNDNYVSDLRMNLLAVIDELDRQGMIDRTRLGVGGHSYGAFSTANALVHTPFFKAGIAGDGMYNRTLTPTGFQSERRDLWSGQKTYLDMSPMLYADKMQGALLMYHGLEDQNVGTNPISSIRMMQALRSEGKVASLYLYPYEDHGPATKETLLDLWGRWTAWLDIYVKNAGAPAKGTITSMKQ